MQNYDYVNKVKEQNERLKETLKVSHETVEIGNNSNVELHRQGGKKKKKL